MSADPVHADPAAGHAPDGSATGAAPAASQPHPGASAWPWALAAVVLLGAGLLLWDLAVPTVLPDERVYVVAGGEYVRGSFTRNLEHPLLGKLLFGLGGVAAGAAASGPTLWGAPAAVVGARLVAVACGAATALGVGRLVAGAAGRWAGLATVAGWLLLPHALRVPGTAWLGFDRLERHAMLDVPATALATWGLVLALRWGRTGRDRDLVLAGLLFGLAAGAKLQAGLLVAGAVAVAVLRRREGPTGGHRPVGPLRALRDVTVLGGTSLVALLLTWAPAGAAAPGAVRFLVDFQGGHLAGGHAVVLAGEVVQRAPWWAHAAFAARDDGWAVAVLLPLLALLGAAVGAGPWRRRAALAAALLVPAAVLASSPVALPFYRYVLLPPAVALAGLAGAAALRRRWLRPLVAAGVATAVVVGALSVVSLARRAPSDYRVVAAHLERAGDPPVLLRGLEGVLRTHHPKVRLVERLADAELVVLDPVVTGTRPPAELLARLRAEGWHAVGVDRLEVWTPPR